MGGVDQHLLGTDRRKEHIGGGRRVQAVDHYGRTAAAESRAVGKNIGKLHVVFAQRSYRHVAFARVRLIDPGCIEHARGRPFKRIDHHHARGAAVTGARKGNVHTTHFRTTLGKNVRGTGRIHVGLPQIHACVVFAEIDVDAGGGRTVARAAARHAERVEASEILGLCGKVDRVNLGCLIFGDIDIRVGQFAGDVHQRAARPHPGARTVNGKRRNAFLGVGLNRDDIVAGGEFAPVDIHPCRVFRRGHVNRNRAGALSGPCSRHRNIVHVDGIGRAYKHAVEGLKRALCQLHVRRAALIRHADRTGARAGARAGAVDDERLEGGRARGRHRRTLDLFALALVFKRGSQTHVIGDVFVDGVFVDRADRLDRIPAGLGFRYGTFDCLGRRRAASFVDQHRQSHGSGTGAGSLSDVRADHVVALRIHQQRAAHARRHLLQERLRVVFNEVDAHRTGHGRRLAGCAAHGDRLDVVGTLGLDRDGVGIEDLPRGSVVGKLRLGRAADSIDGNARTDARARAVGADDSEVADYGVLFGAHHKRRQGVGSIGKCRTVGLRDRSCRDVGKFRAHLAFDFVHAGRAREACRALGRTRGKHKRMNLVGGFRRNGYAACPGLGLLGCFGRAFDGEIRDADLRARARFSSRDRIGHRTRQARFAAAEGHRTRKAPQ